MLALLLTVGTAGCAHEVVGLYGQERGIVADTDDFGMLLLAAGVRVEQLKGEGELTVAEARRLRGQLGLESMDGNLQRYGPRVAANYLLSEVIVGAAPVARPLLNERMRRFERLAVLRPDGHLVMTLTGAMVQCVGPLQVQEGIARAGDFAMGVFYSSEVADALHHAHNLKDAEAGRPLGLIHRDVSPRNIRIARPTGAVKLTDFGAAFSMRVGREETPGLLLKGDLLYASPEYILRLPRMDARSDLFSLGLVLLEALTSKNLFYLEVDTAEKAHAETPNPKPQADEEPSIALKELMALMRDLRPEHVERLLEELPEGVKVILRRALRFQPEERFGTAEELRQALRQQLTALAPGYGRQEVLQETERLMSEGTGLRHVAELFDPGTVPSHLDEHELL